MTRRRPHSLPPDHARGGTQLVPARPPHGSRAAPTSSPVALGADALARLEQRISTRRQQTAIVLATLAVAGAALATGHNGALAIVIARVAAAITLATSLLMLASDPRAHVLELIADGRSELPPAAVRRERRRLLTASHRAALARSLDELADEAPVRLACPRSGRPLYSPLVLVALGAELHATARLLAREHLEVAGAALAELLLTAHDSPLYGPDTTRLRQELHRIAFALQSTPAESHADPHDAPAYG